MSQLILENHPLAPLTTWRIGGAAARLAAPADLEDVWGLMRLAHDRGWPLFFLGRGSNVLIDDAGLPGLTLHLAKSLQGLERHGDTLRAGAGVSLPRLAQAAARLGFAGFEFLAGIPGTVGAAVRLNAGAEGQSLAGVLKRVWVATPQLQLLELTPAELGLGYRTSLLLNFPHWLVVEAEFNLAHPAGPEAIRARMAALIAQRKTRQPANPKSCGSVFKNPAGGPGGGLAHRGRRVQGPPARGRGGLPETCQLYPQRRARHRGPGQGPDGRYSGKSLADPGGGPGAGSGLAAGGFGVNGVGADAQIRPYKGTDKELVGQVEYCFLNTFFRWHRLDSLCRPTEAGARGPPHRSYVQD